MPFNLGPGELLIIGLMVVVPIAIVIIVVRRNT
ncbi:MAG: hypothetical protein AVDCRST_MAG67-2673 [uncultured Solirubrobacteraceae bacterium]|uniref:Uncharacterized protein n=1 Tax=uncultured Solirubrobacteraceae bacterium TaxID=1162706 RepID=A0A6J4T0X2_9ACTN|nr:MAG: hypothetical protein AVDCRST_MAG67-2673 [uncultured Solirubrobacteraceae bacterium]